MMSIPTLAEFAQRLTASQRAAVLWLPADGTGRYHDKSAPRQVSFWWLADWSSKGAKSAFRLTAKFVWVASPSFTPKFQFGLTPAGIKLRAEVEKLEGSL